MFHEVFHVLVLTAFIVGSALAFLGLAGPLLLGQRGPAGVKLSLAIGAVALAALGADWPLHALYSP